MARLRRMRWRDWRLWEDGDEPVFSTPRCEWCPHSQIEHVDSRGLAGRCLHLDCRCWRFRFRAPDGSTLASVARPNGARSPGPRDRRG